MQVLTARRIYFVALVLFVSASVLFVSSLWAQTPADIQRIQQENQRRILEEQQREQQRVRELEERMRSPRGEDLTPKPAPPPKPDDRCFEIRELVLEGVTKLTMAEQAELTRPYTGRCVGLGEINELLQKITNRYVSRGFTTSRVYIPEQDMGAGVFRVLVLEGLVEKILLDGDGVSLRMAFPDLEGKVFNLRDFEQGIDQINRLRSNSATMDIEPGAAPGASVVRIKNAPAKRWTLGFSLDNTGSEPTGLYQAAAVVGVDNPLGLNDYLNLSYRQNPGAEEDSRLSRVQSVFYALPYGPWMFSANASSFDSASRVQGGAISFKTTSENITKGIKVERVMLRDQFLKFSLSTGLTLKDNRSYINDQLVSISSRRLTVWDGNANFSVNAWGGLWSFDLGFAQGLDAANALSDVSGLPPQAPRAQYLKQTYGASFGMPVKAGDTMLSLQSSVYGQYARDVLYGTEQILIGGPFSVRGFRDISITGDSGFYWRNEISTTIPLAKAMSGYEGNAQLRPYFGYDAGHINGKYGIPGGTLAGATIGLYLFAAPLSVQLGYSRPTTMPDRLTNGDDHYAYIRLALDF